jgi:hypothetical protein
LVRGRHRRTRRDGSSRRRPDPDTVYGYGDFADAPGAPEALDATGALGIVGPNGEWQTELLPELSAGGPVNLSVAANVGVPERWPVAGAAESDPGLVINLSVVLRPGST